MMIAAYGNTYSNSMTPANQGVQPNRNQSCNSTFGQQSMGNNNQQQLLESLTQALKQLLTLIQGDTGNRTPSTVTTPMVPTCTPGTTSVGDVAPGGTPLPPPDQRDIVIKRLNDGRFYIDDTGGFALPPADSDIVIKRFNDGRFYIDNTGGFAFPPNGRSDVVITYV